MSQFSLTESVPNVIAPSGSFCTSPLEETSILSAQQVTPLMQATALAQSPVRPPTTPPPFPQATSVASAADVVVVLDVVVNNGVEEEEQVVKPLLPTLHDVMVEVVQTVVTGITVVICGQLVVRMVMVLSVGLGDPPLLLPGKPGILVAIR